jgi:EAL domain-containing protein (putative c-di-GMP-specific phosphodiesterase class I)
MIRHSLVHPIGGESTAEFRADILKMDRSIVEGFERDVISAGVASAVIELAYAIGFETVA